MERSFNSSKKGKMMSFTSDPDMQSYENKLTEAKLIRKKAEEDAQLLANRIALLQAEERKAMRKVDETRMKAQEIRDIKVRNLMQIREKDLARQQREEEERRRHVQNQYANEQKKINQERRKMELHKKLSNDVSSVKNEKKVYLKKLNMTREEEQSRNYDLVQRIRYSQKEFKEKKIQQSADNKARARSHYQSKVNNEMHMKNHTDGLISQLEKKEMELIRRLQQTQNLQKNAYDDLERALSTTLH